MSFSAKIGVFDSGVGGLYLLKELRAQLPRQNFIYLADQKNVPYGEKSLGELRLLCAAITKFFQKEKIKLVVIACNTASAASLYHLRNSFPQIIFVGMEPAVKLAAISSTRGTIGVLATAATFQGELFQNLVKNYGSNVIIKQLICPKLVQFVEAGCQEQNKLKKHLQELLQPLLKQGIDQLVLGCTHYFFLQNIIKEIVGTKIKVLAPANAVVRHTKNLIETNHLVDQKKKGKTTFYTTGSNPAHFKKQLRLLLEIEAEIKQLHWKNNELFNYCPDCA